MTKVTPAKVSSYASFLTNALTSSFLNLHIEVSFIDGKHDILVKEVLSVLVSSQRSFRPNARIAVVYH